MSERKYYSDIINELFNTPESVEYKKTEIKMEIAARIDKAIKKKGMKQKDFAKAMDRTEAEVSKWLSGTHNFTIGTLIEINEVLGTRII